MSPVFTEEDKDRLAAIEICLDELATLDHDYGGFLTTVQRSALKKLRIKEPFVGLGDPPFDGDADRAAARRARLLRVRKALGDALPSEAPRPPEPTQP